MGDWTSELLAESRWRQMPGENPFLVCRATADEARALADPTVRVRVEQWFSVHLDVEPGLRGLIVFIEGADSVTGFAEMVVGEHGYVWRGPYENAGSPPKGVILVVEDDAELRQTVAEVLRLHGYAVVTAREGREAVAALEAMTGAAMPDVILLDLSMPGVDGPDFLAARSEVPDFAAIPVVVTSGDADHPHAASMCDGLIEKPYTVDTLLQAVDRARSVRR
jgi:CheY-like chemotaxis protein